MCNAHNVIILPDQIILDRWFQTSGCVFTLLAMRSCGIVSLCSVLFAVIAVVCHCGSTWLSFSPCPCNCCIPDRWQLVPSHGAECGGWWEGAGVFRGLREQQHSGGDTPEDHRATAAHPSLPGHPLLAGRYGALLVGTTEANPHEIANKWLSFWSFY